MPDLVTLMKMAAREAVAAGKPAEPCIGTVESAAPLQIRIEQKLVLGREQLLLLRGATDYELEIESDFVTENGGDPAHSHGISGKRVEKVNAALKTGEQVLLLRMTGGQKYIVLDRVVKA